LWLNEGLAEFYENTDIHDKDVALGEPSQENILWLRENRLLPLATLFTVDSTSPYYHEEKKGSIFYAESWALTHYLQVKDFQAKTHRLTDYTGLLEQKVDAVTRLHACLAISSSCRRTWKATFGKAASAISGWRLRPMWTKQHSRCSR